MQNRILREHKFRVLLMSELNGTLDSILKESDDKLIEKLIDDSVNSYAKYMIEDLDTEDDEINAKEKLSNADIELIKNFLRQITLKLNEIDKIIKDNLVKWQMERLPREDVNILRLCVYEMYYDEKIDVKIAINEAINIAKDYGNEKVGKFINGILRSIYESQKV